MTVAWRIKSSGEGVAQVGESEVVQTITEFKGKFHTCGKYGHRQNKSPKKNKSEKVKGNKKFIGKCNHCGKVGHKGTNCWEHEANNKQETQELEEETRKRSRSFKC